MRIAIVGAGVAGLAAARTAKAIGHEPVVFEQNDHVGGRIETRHIGEYVFDTGASSIAPRGMAIERPMLRELATSDLVRVEKPIYTHSGLRVSQGDGAKNAEPRYTYRRGNASLPAMLAEGLDVRLGTQIEGIERPSRDRFVMAGETFGAAILTPPVPQSVALMWSLGETRPVSNARYRRCLSVLLGYRLELHDVSFHALLDPEQRHPLTWLCIESVKSPGRAPAGATAIVAQLSPSYSLNHYERDPGAVVNDVVDYVARLFGSPWQTPEVSDVRRWKYSLPDSVALFESVNSPGSRLILAGDGVLAGRVESAYESGVKAANLLENLE